LNQPPEPGQAVPGLSRGPRIGLLLTGVSAQEVIDDIHAGLRSLASIASLDPPVGLPPQLQFNGYATSDVSGQDIAEVLSEQLLLLPGFRTTIQGTHRVPFTNIVFTAERGTPDRDAIERRRGAEESRRKTTLGQVGIPQVARVPASPTSDSTAPATRDTGARRSSGSLSKLFGLTNFRGKKKSQRSDQRPKAWVPGQVAPRPANTENDVDSARSDTEGTQGPTPPQQRIPPDAEVRSIGAIIPADAASDRNPPTDIGAADVQWAIGFEDAIGGVSGMASEASPWDIQILEQEGGVGPVIESGTPSNDLEASLSSQGRQTTIEFVPLGSWSGTGSDRVALGSSLPRPIADLFYLSWFPRVATATFIFAISIVAVGHRVTKGGEFPVSADALGHLYRARYWAEQFRSGNFFPQWTPDWYLGVPLVEYYPPALTYIMGPVSVLTGPAAAYKLFVFFAIPATSILTTMSFRKYLGYPGAISAGLLYGLSPWLLRVMFVQGELPILLTAIILPIGLRLAIDLIDDQSRTRFILVTLFITVLIMSHHLIAMMFMFSITFGLFIYVLVDVPRRLSGSLITVAALVLGVGISFVFLIPALLPLEWADTPNKGPAERVLFYSRNFDLIDIGQRTDIFQPYFGALLILISITAILLLWRHPLVQILAAVSSLTIFMSIGIDNPVIQKVGVLQEFIFFERFLIIGSLSTAILGGIVVQWLLTHKPRRLDPILSSSIVVATVIVLIWVDFGPYFRLVKNSDHQAWVDTTRILNESSPPGRLADFIGKVELSYFPSVVHRNALLGWSIESSPHADIFGHWFRSIRSDHIGFAQRQLQQWWVAGVYSSESDGAGSVVLKESGFIPVAPISGITPWVMTQPTSIALHQARNASVIGQGRSITLASWPWLKLSEIERPGDDDMSLIGDDKLIVVAEIPVPLNKSFQSELDSFLRGGGNVVTFLTNDSDLWRMGVSVERRQFSEEMLLIDIGERVLPMPEPVGNFQFMGFKWETLIVNDSDAETIFAMQDSNGDVVPILSRVRIGEGNLFIVGGSAHIHGFSNGKESLLARIAEYLALEIDGLYTKTTLPIAPSLNISLTGQFADISFDAGPDGGPIILSITEGPHWNSIKLDDKPIEVQNYEGLILMDSPPGIHRFTMKQSSTRGMWFGRLMTMITIGILAVIVWKWDAIRTYRIRFPVPDRVKGLDRRLMDIAFGDEKEL